MFFAVGWIDLLCDVLHAISKIAARGRGWQRLPVPPIEFYGFFNNQTKLLEYLLFVIDMATAATDEP
mgnify:CR=1 FL=1